MNRTKNPIKRRFSLEGRLAAIVSLATVSGILLVYGSLILFDDQWVALVIALPLALTLSLGLVHGLAKRMGIKMAALNNGLLNLLDNDFSVSITNASNDELDEIIAIYNRLAENLRKERQHIYQRELLLDMVIQNSSLCVVLIDQSQRIIYANHHARTVFNQGKPINGMRYEESIQGTSAALREILLQRQEGLFRIQEQNGEELYHLSTGRFLLNARQHDVLLLKHMTLELHRQEAVIWKRVIRTITHELNNSLAPISSMAHSGRLMLEKEKYASLLPVFDTIGERAEHLKLFIEGYAEIAKLPAPNKQPVDWADFFAKLALSDEFFLQGNLPDQPGFFDRVQLQQVTVNLLKNARESGSALENIGLAIRQNHQCSQIDITDRGAGMSARVLENALLPFYTTKPAGSGIGLALCREIVEAHGGDISLSNREGGGLLVRVTLPARGSADAAR